MFVMHYEGYIGQVDFDENAGLFHGEVTNLRDVITFQGRSVDELRDAFTDSIEDYKEFCADRGESPEKPFSGNFILRVDPKAHRRIADAAAREGKSLNAWARDVLERAAQGTQIPRIS